jgi:hypothetical protein
MSKALSYAFLVLAVWGVLELQTKGTEGAFGGAFAGFFSPVESVRGEPAMPRSPITEQVRERVNASMAHSESRRDRLAGGR